MNKLAPIFTLASFIPSFAYASDFGGSGDLVAFIVIFLVGLGLSIFLVFNRENQDESVVFKILKFLGYMVLAFMFAIIFLFLVLTN